MVLADVQREARLSLPADRSVLSGSQIVQAPSLPRRNQVPDRHSSARFRLRQGTADCHERVDAAFSAVDLGSRAGYGQFLLAQAAAFFPAEQGLEAAGIDHLLPDWDHRRRSHLLAQDLIDLGLPVPEGLTVPVVTGGPAMLGWAYVLEGSRLGGKLLRREVAAELPVAFLSDNYPAAWSTIVAVLDEQLTEGPAIDQAIESARSLFALFEQSAQHMNVRRIADVA